jgi:hypothetical protein
MINETDIERAWATWAEAVGEHTFRKLPDVGRITDELTQVGINPAALRRFSETHAATDADFFVMAYKRTYGTWIGPTEMYAAVFPHAFAAGFIAGQTQGRKDAEKSQLTKGK